MRAGVTWSWVKSQDIWLMGKNVLHCKIMLKGDNRKFRDQNRLWVSHRGTSLGIKIKGCRIKSRAVPATFQPRIAKKINKVTSVRAIVIWSGHRLLWWDWSRSWRVNLGPIDYFNQHTRSLINNFNLVLSFYNTVHYSQRILSTFLSLTKVNIDTSLTARTSRLPNNRFMIDIYKPVSSSNIQLASRWSYFLTFKPPHVNLP